MQVSSDTKHKLSGEADLKPRSSANIEATTWSAHQAWVKLFHK